MGRCRAAFTIVEALVVVAIIGLLLAVLIPVGSRSRQSSGLSDSMLNVATLVSATHVYQADHDAQAPMRACGYSLGQVTGGWDTWNFGGKDNDSRTSLYWETNGSGVFDEPAYTRFLNPYLAGERARRPTGYVNSGSGSTWTFSHGHPIPQERASLECKVFKSPGDIASHQQAGSVPGLSAYNDVGTSYFLNMAWWSHIYLTPPYTSFTAAYVEGARRIGLALGGANPNYVWIHDQTAQLVGAGQPTTGEFGSVNMSVMGFADGRVMYHKVVLGAYSGPEYTFLP